MNHSVSLKELSDLVLVPTYWQVTNVHDELNSFLFELFLCCHWTVRSLSIRVELPVEFVIIISEFFLLAIAGRLGLVVILLGLCLLLVF